MSNFPEGVDFSSVDAVLDEPGLYADLLNDMAGCVRDTVDLIAKIRNVATNDSRINIASAELDHAEMCLREAVNELFCGSWKIIHEQAYTNLPKDISDYKPNPTCYKPLSQKYMEALAENRVNTNPQTYTDKGNPL